MAQSIRPVAIVGSQRIPFCRIFTGYADIGNLEMLSAAIKALVDKYNLKGQILGDVVAGAVMKHSRDWSMAREAVLSSGLDVHTPAHNSDRACGTSLSTAAEITARIAIGEIDCGIAGGVDTASDVPIVFSRHYQQILLKSSRGKSFGQKLAPWFGFRPWIDFKPHLPAVTESRTHLNMGQSCELMAQEWGITREAQDELAYQSHMKAAAAWKEGFFNDLVTPFHGVNADNNVRADTTLEKLAKLRPAFEKSSKGTLTAGNSTPLSDGASAVLLASEDWAKARGLPVLAYLTHTATAGVDFAGQQGPREGLLMAPTYAVPKMLDKAGLKLQDFDYYEIHEAFAAQVLCTLKAWESADYCRTRLGRKEPLGSIDRSKLNIKGGSVALAHPFGATGGRILGGLAKILAQKGKGRGLISICTGGGMGVTAILER